MNFFLRLSGILKIYQEDLLCMDFIRLGQFLTKLPDDIPVSFLFQAIASINFPKQKFTQILAQQIEIAAQIKSVSSPAKWDLCTTLVSSVSSFPQSNRIFRRLRAVSRGSVGRAINGANKRFVSRPVLRAPYASALTTWSMEGKGRLLTVYTFRLWRQSTTHMRHGEMASLQIMSH